MQHFKLPIPPHLAPPQKEFCCRAHSRPTCPHNPTKRSLCKFLNTPIKINALATALKNQSSWLSMADITSAFKVLPIHSDFWGLFCLLWKGAYYFAERLTSGGKNSPKIFYYLSEALCCILTNIHKLPYVLHLLDDFLTVTPPSSTPSNSLNTLTFTFHKL